MISKLHDRLGTAGLVVAVVALVAALAGTAIAATGLNSTQKKEVKKIAKQFAGKRGPKGAAGPAGPAGPAGAKGDKGDKGDNGTPGSPGATGATGPTGKTGVTGVTGATGTTGATGVSGFTDTLPSGKTETGTWVTQGTGESLAAISFNIPLAADISETNVKLVEDGATPPAECDNGAGTAPSAGNPEADPGFLCIFEGASTEGFTLLATFKPEAGFSGGAGKTGAILDVESATFSQGGGSFAVTAP
jgi:collagen type I alpha